MFLSFAIASPSSKKIGNFILRFELEGIALLEAYPACSKLFKENGWYGYCDRLTGYHLEVTKAFSQSFDGHKVEFKSLTLQVTEDSVAEATRLSMEGNKWFKRVSLKPSDYNHLLVRENKDIDWEKGIPCAWVKPEYRDPLYLI